MFAPHKSVSLAAEFAPTEAERLLIRNAIHAASDDALRYASRELGVARKGHAGEKGSERGIAAVERCWKKPVTAQDARGAAIEMCRLQDLVPKQGG